MSRFLLLLDRGSGGNGRGLDASDVCRAVEEGLQAVHLLPRTFREARPLRLNWKHEGGEGQARTKFSAFVPGR